MLSLYSVTNAQQVCSDSMASALHDVATSISKVTVSSDEQVQFWASSKRSQTGLHHLIAIRAVLL